MPAIPWFPPCHLYSTRFITLLHSTLFALWGHSADSLSCRWCEGYISLPWFRSACRGK